MQLVSRWHLLASAALLGLLTGCASTTVPLQPHCVMPAESRLSGQFTLDIEQPDMSHQLLIVNQWQDDKLRMLGFNTVGAQVFEGTLAGGEMQVTSARLYRGPDAEWLLWGLVTHQLRDDLQDCLVAADLRIQQQAPVVVMRQDQRIFSSRVPGLFALPQQQMSVDVRRLQ